MDSALVILAGVVLFISSVTYELGYAVSTDRLIRSCENHKVFVHKEKLVTCEVKNAPAK